MRNLILIILMSPFCLLNAQSPSKFSYQSILRDSKGSLLVNQTVGIQFTILKGSSTGTTEYVENHIVNTNENGLVSLIIGEGKTTDSLTDINWGDGEFYLLSEIDLSGGSNYTISITTPLISVPFALHANTATIADSLIGGGSKFVDLITNQTIDGDKTFNSDLLVNGITLGKGGGGRLQNTATGRRALYYNTTGNYNTASGYLALTLNTTGSFNTANGNQALYSNTTGLYNTASGNQALYTNTTGSNNTANGVQALYWNTTGLKNTASGNGALYSNTEGSFNTAIGNSALHSNTTGNINIAIGSGALFENTTGNSNIAIGSAALYNNTTGNSNTATGCRSLISNTTGDSNTANGYGSLYLNTTGSFNTASGHRALYSNNEGNFNTAIGNSALFSNTKGNYNTAIGYQTNTSANTYNNATALGNGAIVSSSNRVRIGNTSVYRIEGQVSWTSVSDGRIKENIQETVPGLSFISELRPVTYTLNTRKQHEITTQAMPDSIKEKLMQSDEEYRQSSSIIRTGFIAQEVEEAAKRVGFDFDGISAPENETDLYGIRYAEFVVPLVKAVQEQQELIKKQQEIIEQQRLDFQKQMQLLNQRIEKLEGE